MSEIQAARDLLLTPYEVQLNRWFYEREKLRLFSAFVLLGTPDGRITAAEGTLDSQYNNTYGIRIELSNYPYGLPKVYPNGWIIHSEITHRFNDGSLCIMRSDQWRKHFTVALVVAKTAIWLNKYEIWKRNGHRWPGLEQKH
jgi:hypothetical protein